MFELYWKNETIPFSLELQTSANDGESGKGMNYHWELWKLDMPESIKPHTEELLMLIQEAVTEWGNLYNRRAVYDISFDFSKYNFFA